MKNFLAGTLIPSALAVVGLVLLVLWTRMGPAELFETRVPGLDRVPVSVGTAALESPEPGEPIPSGGEPSALAGSWPWFRGTNRDAIAADGPALARRWPNQGPAKLWTVELGPGFAAAAVRHGCVYVLDYDETALTDTMRCLSLDDGREIWRNSYPVKIVWNHGMSRTVPAVTRERIISIGPKCHITCWDAKTGQAHWLLDLVRQFGTTVPPWYTGQCPLVDGDRVILAPAGPALLIAVDYKTGETVWESPNPHGWEMTHVSIMPMDFAGRRLYVYCGKGGVAGVAADDGRLLWETTEWKIEMATCPSPVILPDGRIFCSGGYNAGAVMFQLRDQGDTIAVETLFRLKPRQFSSEQQTPVFFDGHLFGVRQKDRQLVCLDLEGREVWNSGEDKFGAGPYMIADGLIYVIDDYGVLAMAEASTKRYRRLAQAQVIEDAHNSWGPMALVDGRLIVRDMTRMVCLDVAESGAREVMNDE